MSRTQVKTTYNVEGPYGSTEVVELFCRHNHSTDFTTFYWKEKDKYVIANLVIQDWDGPTMWEAMTMLMYPFKGVWHKELKDGVEYWQPKKGEI